VVHDSSSEDEDAEDKFQLGVAQSDSEGSFKFNKKGEAAVDNSDAEDAGPQEGSEGE